MTFVQGLADTCLVCRLFEVALSADGQSFAPRMRLPHFQTALGDEERLPLLGFLESLPLQFQIAADGAGARYPLHLGHDVGDVRITLLAS